MPRLGLTKEATEKTVAYLDQIADPHRDQRNRLGVFVLGYLLVMAGLTFAWKKKIWKNIH
jgi:Cytochrome c1